MKIFIKTDISEGLYLHQDGETKIITFSLSAGDKRVEIHGAKEWSMAEPDDVRSLASFLQGILDQLFAALPELSTEDNLF